MAKRALCLIGNGAGGISTPGMLRAWIETGLDYDCLYTTSSGTLNGTLFHQGDLKKLEELWLTISNDKVFTPAPWKMFTWEASFNDDTPLLTLIKKYVNYEKIISNPREFWINTTSLTKWGRYTLECKQLTKEEFPHFVKASATPSPLFPVTKFRDQYLVDGGILNNYSIFDAIENGCDQIVLLRPCPILPKPVKNMQDMLMCYYSLPEQGYFEDEMDFFNFLNKVQKNFQIKVTDICIPRDLGIGLTDFSYTNMDRRAIIEYSYNTAKIQLRKEIDAGFFK